MNIHGGNISDAAEKLSCPVEDIIDFSANINPLGFPSWLREEVDKNISSLIHYPDINQKQFIKALAQYLRIPKEMILGGNGAGELLHLVPPVINPEQVIIPSPSFSEYASSCRSFNVNTFPLLEEDNFVPDYNKFRKKLSSLKGRNLVFIGQPNNPTGTLTAPELLTTLAKEHPDTIFCIDESFADFVPSYISPAAEGNKMLKNIIVIRSMTKFYALPGLRIGYAIADSKLISKIKMIQSPWSVNTLALTTGARAIEDNEYRRQTVSTVTHLRDLLRSTLESFSWLKIFPSKANFILVKAIRGPAPKNLYNFLFERKILIRACSSFHGLDNRFFRIAVRRDTDIQILHKGLEEFSCTFNLPHRKISLSTSSTFSVNKRRKTPALMIQGTSSDAGKSIITAGICRVLHQQGIRVAPFKAQNMALNSAVTPEGREIGRAQALQAKAAGILPDIRMNPLLLKPTHDSGSEIILSGLPSGHIDSSDWPLLKQKAKHIVQKSYDSLADEYDAIILEGAGSPGEINLKKNDIVNMNMARYADSPVLIVGDIDRGGVYASFIGTMAVFEEWERNLVRGFIVNKFRGDETMLQSANSLLEYRTGKPVIGVIPYFNNIVLPQEDSFSFKEQLTRKKIPPENSILTIGVLDLPSLSNLSDFDAFIQENKIFVKFITEHEEINTKLDTLIIPGSKNVARDLQYLNARGLTTAIKKLHTEKKTSIVGICGGFQMLGRSIADPEGIESNKGIIKALGLLDMETVFHRGKHLREITTVHIPSGIPVKGYEIHHGVSNLNRGSVILGTGEKLLGAANSEQNVWGTYLHGIFDNDDFRHWFLKDLLAKKGVQDTNILLKPYNPDRELNNLAEIIKSQIDVRFLLSIMGM